MAGEPRATGPTLRANLDGRAIHWKVDGAPLSASADPPLVAAITKAMHHGHPLHVAGPISEQLLAGVDAAQDLLTSWYPETLHKVPVVAATRNGDQPPGTGVGLFFSGGVDAFYSLMNHADELTHLVMLRGFDVKLGTGSEQVWKPIRAMGEAVCNQLGLRYVEVKTNARRAVSGLSWLRITHGAILASAGLALQNTVGRMLIASSRGPTRLDPQGTHPDLDPLWSTERTRFQHDTPVERIEKVAALLSYVPAMRWLRVCHRNPHRYNCGECEKCIRTMIALRLTGGLGRCETLPDRIDLDAVAALEHNTATIRRSLALIDECETNGLPDVADALRRSIAAHSHLVTPST